MAKPFVFEKPVGMRDILPEVVEKKRAVIDQIQRVLKGWGYGFIETPTLEYFDTVGSLTSIKEQRLFKLLDRTGRSLVLRPDMTAPIARVIGSLLQEEDFPIRLAYHGNVFRAQENEARRNAEFPEMGVELIGEEAPDADAEMIALAVAALQSIEVQNFKLAVGHIGYMNAIFKDVFQNEEKEREIRSFLHQKDYVGYRHFVEKEALAGQEQQALLSILELRGGIEILEEAKRGSVGQEARKALADLEELWSVLEAHRATGHVIFDLSLISHIDYYTGIIFEGYADQLAFPICSGGRYDHLLGQFGRTAPATGFSIKLDRVLEVSQINLEKGLSILITYSSSTRTEAFRQASRYREEGYAVTLHRSKDGQAVVENGAEVTEHQEKEHKQIKLKQDKKYDRYLDLVKGDA